MVIPKKKIKKETELTKNIFNNFLWRENYQKKKNFFFGTFFSIFFKSGKFSLKIFVNSSPIKLLNFVRKILLKILEEDQQDLVKFI